MFDYGRLDRRWNEDVCPEGVRILFEGRLEYLAMEQEVG
jgi:hypothetical protein